MDGVSDERLAARAADGDLASFEELVVRYRRSVYRLARSITGNHEDADDAVQETFIRVFRSLGRFDPSRPFRPWIKKITFNTSLTVLRKTARKNSEVDMDLERFEGSTPGPEQLMQARDLQAQMDEALSALPTDLRATFILRASEGMSYRDIARTTGVRIGTVMSRLSRAREKILRSIQSAPGSAIQGGEGL